MRLNLRLVAVVLSLAVGARAQEISGRVVRADSGAPIEGVTIQLEVALGDQMPHYIGEFYETVKTDRNGEYRLVKIPAGAYEMSVTAVGFISDVYPHESDTENRTSTHPGVPFLVMKDGIQLRGVDFKMAQEAVIGGVVMGGDGRPVAAGTSVVAIRKGEKHKDGSASYFVAGTRGTTDAQGRFEVRQLPPDDYLVCVGCAPTSIGDWGICFFGDLEATTYPATWYGDALAVEAAKTLPVRVGEERIGVQIAMKPVNRQRVIVWPIMPLGPAVAGTFDVFLRDWFDEGMSQADGSYVIANVPPGHYTVVVRERVPGGGRDSERTVDVGGSDVTVQVEAAAKGDSLRE